MSLLYQPMNVTDVIVEEEITKIKANTFSQRNQLRTSTFPQSLQEIEEGVLYACHSLESVIFPKHVAKSGKCAFYNCTVLRKVIFENRSKLKCIGAGAFTSCKMHSHPFPLIFVYFSPRPSLHNIKERAFDTCHKLQFINVPSSIISVHHKAFDQCGALPITSSGLDQDRQL